MDEEDQILVDIVKILHDSIQTACADYFRWTHGRVVYDDGVEALMQVYAAQHLHRGFDGRRDTVIRMERRMDEIVPGTPGRVDLSVEFPDQLAVIVEFKRYVNPAVIRSDLARLAMIADLPEHKAILAAPCFIREGEEDWTPRLAQNLKTEHPDRQVFLSGPRALPTEHRHPARWDRSSAVVVIVPAPGLAPV